MFVTLRPPLPDILFRASGSTQVTTHLAGFPFYRRLQGGGNKDSRLSVANLDFTMLLKAKTTVWIRLFYYVLRSNKLIKWGTTTLSEAAVQYFLK